jgi:hypothetical protein
MRGTQHTPGPWAVENPMGEDIGLWIVQDGLEARQWSCIAVVTDDEDGTARDEGGRFIGRNEQRANARVIAAGPDMLKALHEAYDRLSADYQNLSTGNWHDPDAALVASTVLDAIAKAEGR